MAFAQIEELEELTDDEDFIQLVNVVLRAPRTIRERTNHFIKWNEFEFKQRFRMSKVVVRYIIDKISDRISSKTNRNNALSPEDMVLLTLRFLATGTILTVVGELSGCDKATVSRAINTVLTAIAELRPEFIEMPSTEDEITQVRQGFYNIAKFPRCIGAIDCTHVRIQLPSGEDAERFRNRKGFFSYNVQAVCDSELLIRNIVCRWHGSAHDSTIFNNSRLKVRLENEEFGEESLIVGDSGYAVKSYLITPLANPIGPAENLFNQAQIRSRNPIERSFGSLKRRFLCVAFGIRLHVSKVELVVVACAVLHNIAVSFNDAQPRLAREEEAVNLTMHVNEYAGERRNGNENNLTRNLLITGHFARLL